MRLKLLQSAEACQAPNRHRIIIISGSQGQSSMYGFLATVNHVGSSKRMYLADTHHQNSILSSQNAWECTRVIARPSQGVSMPLTHFSMV